MTKRFWVIIGLLLVTTITCSCGPPKEQESSATVIEAVNKVDAHPRPKDDWGAATVGMDIYGGGQVRTGPASSARLQLLEGVVRLWAESIFTVRESTTRQERLVTTLFLQKGRLWAHLTTNQPHEFTVETASAVAAVRDTRFSVKVDLDQTALVSVAEGEVVLTAQEESVTVVAGQQAIVKPGQPPSPPEPMSDEERALWATEGEMPELESLLPTPMPTLTPTIIPTPTPTDTLVPTDTPAPMPTDTPVPTDTPALEPTPTNTPVPPTPVPIGGGRIAFVSDRDGNEEIYVMNADGSGQTNLTNHPARDYVPSWSPDGALIAFASERDGNSEIYVMNADGSGLTRLTDNPASDYHPAWSPDGTRITFTSSRDGDWGEIYVMNADGSGQARLTNDPALDWEPAWSPDGMRIAFTSGRDGKDEIYVMNADGSGQMNLTSPGVDIIPAWSPDGTRIAFASGRDGNMEIYVMNADGSGQTRLTDNPAWDDMATWSLDGTRIAFMSQRDSGNAEIYVMNADGSGLTRLTNNPAHDMWPSWSPR